MTLKVGKREKKWPWLRFYVHDIMLHPVVFGGSIVLTSGGAM